MSLTEQVRCDVPVEWTRGFSQCLFEWQGLESGILALVAAGFSVLFLRRQIAQSDRHERERLQRQQNAVRATLPLTLSGLIENVRQMILALDRVRDEIKQNQFTVNFEPPKAPTEHISELQAVIASTDKQSVIEPISEIIRQIQTLWARVQILRDEQQQRRQADLISGIDDWIIQSAKIHALIESLFLYARTEDDEGPASVPWARAESIIFQLGIESATLVALIRKGLEISPYFWVANDR